MLRVFVVAVIAVLSTGGCSRQTGDVPATEATGDTDLETSSDDSGSGEDESSAGDDEVKLDFQQPEPDPFETAPLGCGDPPPGELLAIEGAAAFRAEDGAIRLRLLDSGEEHYWDILIDLPPSPSYPVDHAQVPFSGELSVPRDFEWAHFLISGAVDLTVVSAELGGCFVAEITASTNDWDQVAPPLGWVASELQPWP